MSTTNVKRMPRPKASPQVSPRVIAAPLGELKKFLADETKVRREYPWAERFVMGLPLPPWQRGFVWSVEQSRRFITSAWTGVPLGCYVLTDMHLEPGNEVIFERLSNCVLEGQQRLRAMELFFLDQLAVPDAAGVLTTWSELERQEQMWFEKVIFDCGITRETDEDALRAYYDTMNFGGTAHEEHERASRAT